jgi:YhcH/YjgK/YiaL family protein
MAKKYTCNSAKRKLKSPYGAEPRLNPGFGKLPHARSAKMIFDRIENLKYYYGISPRIEKALKYLETADLARLPEGKIEIEGDDIYASVTVKRTQPYSAARFEAHKKYIDIQYAIEGKEDILCWFTQMAKGLIEESPEKDVYFYDSIGRPITIGGGRFAIHFPTDIHAPGLTHMDKPENESDCKKIVVKVRV